MKHILITGVNSYVGNAVEQYLMEQNADAGRELYRVDKVSLRDGSLEKLKKERVSMASSSSEELAFDAVLHVAGIAHADVGNVSEETKSLYYRVNRDLAVETAKWAKAAGIPQFLYLSSVIVYGESVGKGRITAGTVPAPANFYGDSKLQAENELRKLETEGFQVAVLRLPMVYGRNSKGNFPMLVQLARRLPVFPAFENQRSMIYVENLAEFIRLMIECGKGGLFFPQNREYVTTAKLVKAIGEAEGKNVLLCRALNPFVRLACKMPGKVGRLANKAFGTLAIDKELSGDLAAYQIYSFQESVKKSV